MTAIAPAAGHERKRVETPEPWWSRLLMALRRRLLGHRLCAQIDQIDRLAPLEEQLRSLGRTVRQCELVLAEASRNPQAFWLFANRAERMDANAAFVEQSRREFHLARYRFAGQFAAGKAVVDTASGTGYGAQLLRRNGGASSVIGVEIDAEAVAYATARYAGDGVTFVCRSVLDTGLPNASVDLVTSFETIEHVEQVGALLSEWKRVLKPDGVVVLSTPNAWELVGHAHHRCSFNRESLQQLLQTWFKDVQLFNQNSGGTSTYNRGQPAGIVPSTENNQHLAECLIAVCH